VQDDVERLLRDALAAESVDRSDLRRIVDSASDFDQAVDRVRRGFPQWRLGQAQSNVLRVCRPDLYSEVTGTEQDPFYRDDRVTAFRRWMADRRAPG